MKNLIIYKGKYGATQQYAKWLSEELHMPALSADASLPADLQGGGVLLMGSSVYIGKLQLSDWINTHQHELDYWKLYLFVVSGTTLNETAKLNKYLSDSVPARLLSQCRVYFLPGRLIYKNLSWRDRFMLRMGALFYGKKEGKKMLTDYNDVKKEHLKDMISDVRSMLQQESASVCSL